MSGPPAPRLDAPLRGLPPVAAPDARLLVLGSFPGVASLREQRYYAHPRNQFWPIVGALLGWPDAVQLGYAERLAAARRAGLAIWDVTARCRRDGSLDSAIREAEPNDITGLVQRLPALRGIAHNGAASARAMRVTAALGLPVWRLPSTSPAHASWSLERKREAWRVAFEACGLVPAGSTNPGAQGSTPSPARAAAARRGAP